jgi:hypothetical protein
VITISSRVTRALGNRARLGRLCTLLVAAAAAGLSSNGLERAGWFHAEDLRKNTANASKWWLRGVRQALRWYADCNL